MNKEFFRHYIFLGALVLFSIYLVCDTIGDAKAHREVNEKLDRISSETDAVHSRIDALEENIDTHNAENGEIINTIIQNVDDLKDHVDEEIKRIDKHIDEVEEAKQKKKEQEAQQTVYTASVTYEDSGYTHPFRSQGTTSDGTYKYTWYSQRALPGGGLNIPGRHVDEDGFVRDESGNLCIESRDLDNGTEVDTPFGKAVVYDYCPNGNLDIYTDW